MYINKPSGVRFKTSTLIFNRYFENIGTKKKFLVTTLKNKKTAVLSLLPPSSVYTLSRKIYLYKDKRLFCKIILIQMIMAIILKSSQI